jgi:selenide,water dikinase
VLSKPVGTALALAGGTPADKAATILGMRRINRVASEELQALHGHVHAVTDVTGYGLAGHGWEMAERGDVRVLIDTDALRAYPGAREAAQRGVRTGGDPRNREYVRDHLISSASADGEALCMDPQTSGGLLAAVDPRVVDELSGDWYQVGEVAGGDAAIELR